MKKVVQNVIMILGIAFFIGIFFPSFRLGMAQAVDPILHPLLGFGKIHIVIFILASFTALYSSLIQRFTVDYKFMKFAQQKIAEYQKRYFKAVKENNKFLLKQLEKEKDDIKRLQAELMDMNFRTMFYTVVVTIPIWIWLWYVIYNVQNLPTFYPMWSVNATSHFNVTIPFSGEIHVSDYLMLPLFTWWIFWYILCSIAVGQIFRRVLQE
ncbi:MAG: hypothetical protein DRP01_02655 [Archaeoglobales archaeon]|nr:MAG: hypothetical protein DRP01_02655 [Archaeoglobales archaeon]